MLYLVITQNMSPSYFGNTFTQSLEIIMSVQNICGLLGELKKEESYTPLSVLENSAL